MQSIEEQLELIERGVVDFISREELKKKLTSLQYKVVRNGYEEIVKNATIRSLAAKIRDGEAVLNSVLE